MSGSITAFITAAEMPLNKVLLCMFILLLDFSQQTQRGLYKEDFLFS